jgi:hypothetical protein
LCTFKLLIHQLSVCSKAIQILDRSAVGSIAHFKLGMITNIVLKTKIQTFLCHYICRLTERYIFLLVYVYSFYSIKYNGSQYRKSISITVN